TDLRMRLRQRLVLLLQLSEQAHVLDGDDGLVGERLEQLHLRRRERPGAIADDDDRAERASVAKQGHAAGGPPGSRARKIMRVRRICEQVLDVYDGSRQDRASGHLATIRPQGIYAPDEVERLGSVVVVGREVQELAIEAAQEAVESFAE